MTRGVPHTMQKKRSNLGPLAVAQLFQIHPTHPQARLIEPATRGIIALEDCPCLGMDHHSDPQGFGHRVSYVQMIAPLHPIPMCPCTAMLSTDAPGRRKCHQ